MEYARCPTFEGTTSRALSDNSFCVDCVLLGVDSAWKWWEQQQQQQRSQRKTTSESFFALVLLPLLVL